MADIDRRRHPSIFRIGQVSDDGHKIRITHWGLSWCLTLCGCHVHPVPGVLVMVEDQTTGDLGLRSTRPCDCCTPWTADELAAILRDLHDLADLEAA